MVDENYEGAQRFGGLTYLVQGRVDTSPRAVSELVNDLLARMAETTVEDFLLLSGSSLVSALAFELWLQLHDKCKLLLYKGRKSGQYEAVTIDRDALKKTVAFHVFTQKDEQG